MAGTPLAVGTVIPAGGDAQPTSTNKASAAALWGGVPAVLGGVIAALSQAGVLFPDAPAWVLSTISMILIIVSPIAGYYGAYNTPNKTEQAVQIVQQAEVIDDTPGEHAAPEV